MFNWIKKIYSSLKAHYRARKLPLCWVWKAFDKQVPKSLRGFVGFAFPTQISPDSYSFYYHKDRIVGRDASGLVQFTTTDHSTNELMLSDPVVTNEATNVGYRQATLNGESYEDGDVYFAYRVVGDPDWIYTTKVNQVAGTFSETVEYLDVGTDYEFKAMLDVDTDTYEGLVNNFSTNAINNLAFENYKLAALTNDITSAPEDIDISEHPDFIGDNDFPTNDPFTVAIWTEEEPSPQHDPNRTLAILKHKTGSVYYVLDWAIEGTGDNTFSAGDKIGIVSTARVYKNLNPTW